MQIPIVSLKDTLKLVLQSLQLATILPTSVFITINLFIIPFLFPQLHLSLKNEALDVILFLFLITLSYMLYAYNYLFIRFLWLKLFFRYLVCYSLMLLFLMFLLLPFGNIFLFSFHLHNIKNIFANLVFSYYFHCWWEFLIKLLSKIFIFFKLLIFLW